MCKLVKGKQKFLWKPKKLFTRRFSFKSPAIWFHKGKIPHPTRPWALPGKGHDDSTVINDEMSFNCQKITARERVWKQLWVESAADGAADLGYPEALGCRRCWFCCWCPAWLWTNSSTSGSFGALFHFLKGLRGFVVPCYWGFVLFWMLSWIHTQTALATSVSFGWLKKLIAVALQISHRGITAGEVRSSQGCWAVCGW